MKDKKVKKKRRAKKKKRMKLRKCRMGSSINRKRKMSWESLICRSASLIYLSRMKKESQIY